MAFDVSVFRSKLTNDGARASLFDVTLTLPPLPGLVAFQTDEVTFKIRSTSLPGDTVSSIEVPYFGRTIKVAGTRTFPDWSVTVINDEDFRIRNNFEIWMSSINSHANNLRNVTAVRSSQYSTHAIVRQYAKAGGPPIKAYKFVGLFPIDVAPIDLDWAMGDQIEEFAVTFAYQWWESTPPESPVATTDTGMAILI